MKTFNYTCKIGKVVANTVCSYIDSNIMIQFSFCSLRMENDVVLLVQHYRNVRNITVHTDNY